MASRTTVETLPKAPRGKTLFWLPLFLSAAILLCTLGLFLATGAELGNWQRALNLLQDRADPLQKGAPLPGLEVPLSIAGYLLVPTFIALIVTTSVQLFVSRYLSSDVVIERKLIELRRRGRIDLSE